MKDRKPVTLFSFDSNVGSQYGVAAPGEVRIEAGMSVVAFLSEPGNWQTLVGWRDCASGELVIESATREFPNLLMLSIFAAVLLWSGMQLKIVAIPLLIIALLILGELSSLRRIRQARRELLEAEVGIR
jgi:hypothetical protein